MHGCSIGKIFESYVGAKSCLLILGKKAKKKGKTGKKSANIHP